MPKYDLSLLYVEDDIDTAESMTLILNEYFAEVHIAQNAEKAIEIFQNQNIDIVISDIELPEMNGLELVKKLREIDENVIVIMFSAYDTREYLFKAIELSVCDYLVKPFHLEQFERVLDKCTKKLRGKRLHSLAYVDQLTGIYNRHKMLEVFESLQKENVEFGFVMIDIDDFKKINDTYGHLQGDKVLQKLSLCIKNSIRQSDFFGRWGGEEFVILMPNIDRLQLLNKVESLRQELQRCDFEIPSNVTVSMGVGLYEGESDVNELVQKVDKALYKAKRNGKNRVELA